MNIQQAKRLKKGQVIEHKIWKNADGTRQRWKVTSIKTWKTREDVEVHLKRGLYEFYILYASDMDNFVVPRRV